MLAEGPVVALGNGTAGQEAGGAVAVPHSAQNFAVALRLALQLVQCFCVGVPHSAQNLDPTGIWLSQFEQLIIAVAAAAGAGVGAAAGAGACGAAGGCP